MFRFKYLFKENIHYLIWLKCSNLISDSKNNKMKISPFLISLTRAGNFVEKQDASQFLERQPRANTGLLTEEFRTGK